MFATNDIKSQDALEAYHTSWKIEDLFRIMKSTLEVRPVFHWTKDRIKGSPGESLSRRNPGILKLPELSNKILKLLKIKPPKNITPKEELSL